LGGRGHRPKNGPKKPHFRVKICKMHLFCLNLKILGGTRAPLVPPSYSGTEESEFFQFSVEYQINVTEKLLKGMNFTKKFHEFQIFVRKFWE